MGILDKFKRKGNKDDAIENLAQKHSKTAVDYAKSFQKKFNYSPDSIKDLEEILDYYSKDVSASQPTENQIWSMAIIFGSYLGEVMLQNGLGEKGFSWGKDDNSDIPLLSDQSGNFITPNDKVYKRLVNGAEDNIVSFYDIIMGNKW